MKFAVAKALLRNQQCVSGNARHANRRHEFGFPYPRQTDGIVIPPQAGFREVLSRVQSKTYRRHGETVGGGVGTVQSRLLRLHQMHWAWRGSH